MIFSTSKYIMKCQQYASVDRCSLFES